jgi:ATP-dependent Clp protease ATP-binding subunit ClpA
MEAMDKPILSSHFNEAIRNSSLLSINLKNHTINSCHLLAGALEIEENIVSQNLLALTPNKDDFLQVVRSLADTNGKIHTETPSWLPAGSIALTDESEKIIISARTNGIKDGKAGIQHLISAMIEDNECIANSLLVSYFDIEQLKQKLSTWED